MFMDELDQIENDERRDHREERRLLPVDSHSQLDTGFIGRSDCDTWERSITDALRDRRRPTGTRQKPLPFDSLDDAYRYSRETFEAVWVLIDGFRYKVYPGGRNIKYPDSGSAADGKETA